MLAVPMNWNKPKMLHIYRTTGNTSAIGVKQRLIGERFAGLDEGW